MKLKDFKIVLSAYFGPTVHTDPNGTLNNTLIQTNENKTVISAQLGTPDVHTDPNH